MSEDWGKRVKKLALAFETGWEYIAGSDEAGSVLTDVFLQMEGKNQGRFRGMWKKHELEFLQTVPLEDNAAKRLRTALVVKASGKYGGKRLKKGTKAYTILEKEGLVRFRTCSGLTLTSAALRYGIYKKGLSAWLSYDGGTGESAEESRPIRLFQAVGGVLARPIFEWGFGGLCDGRGRLSVEVAFGGNDGFAGTDAALPGKWSVTDGQEVYPLSLERRDNAFVLTGETPGFAERLDGKIYTIRLEFPAGGEPPQEWREALCEDIALKEAAETVESGLCLMDEGTTGFGCVKPFGQALDEASCCYFACDRAAAGRDGEITLKFTESYETEEKLPQQPPQEYQKLYKKYPWMKPEEPVRDWQAGNTVWEYFNGSLWLILPGSGGWQTGCCPEGAGERAYRWEKPRDMQPCAIDGESHFYIRLRLVSVRHAFAAYYRKYVPVMGDIRFETGERALKPVMRRLPERAQWQEEKMYLGFDQGVTDENIWYTGTGSLTFRQEQIIGKGAEYEREAFWVELEGGGAENWRMLVPNYVEIMQEKGAQEDDLQKENLQQESAKGGRSTHLTIPEAADFSVEADNMEALDAVSVSAARYDGDGPPVEEQMRLRAAEHYFAHYGRLVTLYDMELLLQERYPFLRVASCLLQEDRGELLVSLRQVSPFRGGTRELLPEISEWLRGTILRTGALWLKGTRVSCTLSSGEPARGAGESMAEEDMAGEI